MSTKGEEQKARVRRILGGVVAQLLVEMGIESLDLQETLAGAFDGEPASEFADFEQVPDEALRKFCREAAIATAPRELKARLAS